MIKEHLVRHVSEHKHSPDFESKAKMKEAMTIALLQVKVEFSIIEDPHH